MLIAISVIASTATTIIEPRSSLTKDSMTIQSESVLKCTGERLMTNSKQLIVEAST